MLCLVAFVGTDASEEFIACIVRVTKIGEVGTTLVVTSNRSTRSLLISAYRLIVKPQYLEALIMLGPLLLFCSYA
jgi:hypothetical protein